MLHKENRDIHEQENVNEDENRELHRAHKVYEEMMDSMERKIASMYEEGTLKLSDADVGSSHPAQNDVFAPR